MIRVLHIGLSESFGGIESFLLNLHKVIDRERFRFDYVAYGSNTLYEDEFKVLGAKVYHLTNRRNPFVYTCELREIMSNGYDIIHVHKNSMADSLPVLCAWLFGKGKIIVHAHNSEHEMSVSRKILHCIGKTICELVASEKIACSKVAGEWVFGRGSTYKLLKNGVDLKRFEFDCSSRKEVRQRYGIADDSLLIGCVGRLTGQKNQQYAIRVFKKLVDKGAKAQLLLVGNGPELDSLVRLVCESNLSSLVSFTGQITDVDKIMSGLDCLLMPSLYEGFPITAIEAQAAGLPIIASSHITEEANITPLFQSIGISLEELDSWVSAIRGVDMNVRKSYSEKMADFDWGSIGRAMMDVYILV